MDPKPDRLALGAMALIWMGTLATAKGRARPRFTRSNMDVAIGIFFAVVVASILFNAERIAMADEMQVALKKLLLLAAFVLFFYIVATSIRPSELPAFGTLIIALGCILGIGVIWEYRTDVNIFFDWTEKLLPPGFDFRPELSNPEFGRRSITGPTTHALAVTSLLAMALPFALIRVLDAVPGSRRILWILATFLILAGTMSTLRKTAIFAPAAALLPLLCYRPRQMVKLLPFGLVAIIAIQATSPGALGSLKSQMSPDRLQSVGTVQDRIADYDAIQPDEWAYWAVGRGYGTYDHNKYRLLDNQYLGIRMGTGLLGFAGYIGLIVGAFGVAHLGIRARDRIRSPIALAAAATAAVFAVVSSLFDILAFPQVPYMFLTAAALAVAATRKTGSEAAPAPRSVPAWPPVPRPEPAAPRPEPAVV
jgi:hypothetical protein